MEGTAQDPALEARVGRLGQDMHEVKSTLGRLEALIVSIHAQMPYLATKAELEGVRGDLGTKIEGFRGDLEAKIEGLRAEVRVGLAGKPGFVGMWTMGATLFGLVVAGITAGAAYLPLIARAFHTAP